MDLSTEQTLQGDDLETWRRYLEATRLLFDGLDRRLQADAGVSLADFGLLARLSEADEWGIRMGDLADSTVFSRSRISHAVDRLERMGWVERRACPTDRRGSYASLTDAGRVKLRGAEPIHAEAIRMYFLDPLGEDGAGWLRSRMSAIKASLVGGG